MLAVMVEVAVLVLIVLAVVLVPVEVRFWWRQSRCNSSCTGGGSNAIVCLVCHQLGLEIPEGTSKEVNGLL